ncbi:MAG: ATP-binding protein, partial [Chloroflexi bacterium]|nr:ATP-binding protein [Chloroflexota bacterium]
HPSDWPDLLALVSRHEGDESRRIAAHWFALQPEGVLVVRNEKLQPVGFAALVALHQATPADLSADPGAQAAWHHLESRAPLRCGECATLIRFWMAAESYQGVSSVQSLIAAQAARHYLSAPQLAFTFLVCADAEFWAPAFSYFDLARIREAEFEVGGRRYAVFGHDWRVVPPLAWLDLLAAREVSSAPVPPAPRTATEPMLVLSRETFGAAVLNALRGFTRPEALRASPLLRSRLVADRAGAAASAAERVAVLRATVQGALDGLQASPREAKLYRAVHHTYVQPAPTQEQAAELLDIPFSTFRRHLRAGVERVTEVLWRRELGG